MVPSLEKGSGAGNSAREIQVVPELNRTEKHPCYRSGTCPVALSDPAHHSITYYRQKTVLTAAMLEGLFGSAESHDEAENH
jgi:hypothetical protein